MGSIPRQLLLQLILILINAFFAMTEMAVVTLNAGKVRRMAEEGDKAAPRILRMVEEPSAFLSTIQIAITLSGYLGSAFAAENFSDPLVNWIYNGLGFQAVPERVLDTVAVVVITIILSYFTLVLGELVPKRIAMQKPYQVAKISAGVVSAMAAVVRPVVWLLSASTNGVLRLLHMKVEAQEEAVTEDEIRMMVDLGEANGSIESGEREMIDNVFEFGDAMVRDVMVHLSRYPVYDGDIHNILGILNAREFLLDRVGDQTRPLTALLRPAYFVPDTLKASILMQDMRSKKIHIAIVVDEYGDTAGLVTMEDLLEEIVGNIYDEYDPSEPAEIEELEPGLWRVSGSADVEEVAEAVGVEIPEDDLEFDTVGGLVFSQLHTIPKDGTVLDVDAYGMHIHVEHIEDRRIVAATVCRSQPAPAPEEAAARTQA